MGIGDWGLGIGQRAEEIPSDDMSEPRLGLVWETRRMLR